MGKYGTGKSLVDIRAGPNCSWGWRSILWGRDLLSKGLVWNVENSKTIKIFKDQWIPEMDNPLVLHPSANCFSDFRVSHFINDSTKSWRIPLLKCFYPDNVISRITSIHNPSFDLADRLVWKHTKDGNFTVKSGFFSALNPGPANQRDISLWKKVWGLRLPPKLGLFTWKIIHNILPVKNRLAKRGVDLDTSYCWCLGMEEDIDHLFLNCPKAQMLWRASTLGFDF